MRYFLVLLFLLCTLTGYSQGPATYYSFNAPSPLTNNSGNNTLTTAGTWDTSSTSAIAGKYLVLNASTTKSLSGSIVTPTNSFTVQFALKMLYDFQRQRDPIILQWGNVSFKISWPDIIFQMDIDTSSTIVPQKFTDVQTVTLDGVGRKSWRYISDGGWHLYSLVYDSTSSTKRIYIDGLLCAGFEKAVPKGKVSIGASQRITLNPSTTSYQKVYAGIDEVAVYDFALSASRIYRNYLDISDGQPYSNNSSTPPVSPAVIGSIDTLEFPVGHIQGSVNSSAVDDSLYNQLTQFPRPRYKRDHTMPRIVNWMALDYSSCQLQRPAPSVYQQTIIARNIQSEIVQHWNYYHNFVMNIGRIGDMSDTLKYNGAFILQANQNPTWPEAILTFWQQIAPRNAGFTSSNNYADNKRNPAGHYLRNAAGKFLDGAGNPINGTTTQDTNKRVLSPAAPLDSIRQDGLTQKYNIQQLLSKTTKPIAFVSENAENLNYWNDAAIQADPAVVFDKTASGLDWPTYKANRLKRFTQTYKNEFMSLPGLINTSYVQYTIFGMDGTNGTQSSFPRYSEMRQLQDYKAGSSTNHYRPTFDMYARWPSNWRYGTGPWKGWGNWVQGRNTELAIGDTLSMPFISGGWNLNEEGNMRPAQMLGLLKCMANTGAESFHEAYFNIELSYQPPNPPPADPKGYAWQYVMGSYTQAITSWYQTLFYNGKVLDGDVTENYGNAAVKSFSYYAGNKDIIVTVRQNNANSNQYIIASTIQNYSNQSGTTPLEADATISLAGSTVQFKTRRQGSVYFYEKNTSTMYQLDGWHEYKHPQRWSKDFILEGELSERTSPKKTYGNVAQDYRSAYTVAHWTGAVDSLVYYFEPTDTDTLYFWVKARIKTIGDSTNVRVFMDNLTVDTIKNIVDTTWYYYRLNQASTKIKYINLAGDVSHRLRLLATNNKIEIDKIVLTPNNQDLFQEKTTVCAFTPTITASGATTFCSGGSVGLTATAGSVYLWSSGATSRAITATTAATYTVTVTDASGCTGSASQAVTVNALPSAPSLLVTDSTLCVGDTTSIGMTAAFTTYLWSTLETTSTIVTDIAGVYNVRVTNGSGCSKTSRDLTIDVIADPGVHLLPALPFSVCQDSSFVFKADSISGSTYHWYRSGTSIISSAAASIRDSLQGNYYVTVNDGFCTYGSLDTVTVQVRSCAACERPYGYSVGTITKNSVVIGWKSNIHVNFYVVKILNNFTSQVVITQNCNDVTRRTTVTGLQANKTYRYTITAVCGNGESLTTSPRSFITKNH